MPPPKRPKKGLTWMNELLSDDVTSSESAAQENLLHNGGSCNNNNNKVYGDVENSINKSDLQIATTMVRSDSMSSTDSLKENKVPVKVNIKDGNENGEKCPMKLRALSNENTVGGKLVNHNGGNLLEQPGPISNGKHGSMCVLLENGHQHSNSDVLEGKSFKHNNRKPILEDLMSARPADLKTGKYKHSNIMAAKVSHAQVYDCGDEGKSIMAGVDRQPKYSHSGPVDLSTVCKPSASRSITATCTSGSQNDNTDLPTASGSVQESGIDSSLKWYQAPKGPPSEICPVVNNINSIDSEDKDKMPPLLSLKRTRVSSFCNNTFVCARDGINDKLLSAYVETADDKPVSFTIDEDEQSDTEVKPTLQVMEQLDDYNPAINSHQPVTNQARGEPYQNYKQNVILNSLLRKGLSELPSTKVKPYLDTDRLKRSPSEQSVESELELRLQAQDNSTSLNSCINSIVASVLLSKTETQRLNGSDNDVKTVLHGQSQQTTQTRDYRLQQTTEAPSGDFRLQQTTEAPSGDFRLQQTTEAPSSEYGVNYAMAYLKVLPPSEQCERYAGGMVLPSCESQRLKPCTDSRRNSCEEPDSMSSGRPYPSEKMQPPVSAGNVSYVTDNTALNSPTTSSPTHHSDVHSPNMEITSSTSDVTKRPLTSGSSGDDVKSSTSHLCQVCNDAASGFHYGVWSCEGCKAFFKRSLQGPVNYICPATNSCTIDKHRRKSCQACRLRKCIEMGMSRGNCREKKGPSQRAMKRKSQDTDIKSETPSKMSSQYVDQSVSCKREPQVCSVRPLVDPDLRSVSQTCSPQNTRPEQNNVHPLVEHLLTIEPPVRLANTRNLPQQSAEDTLAIILHLADAELMDVVGWARGIPGYMELPLVERMHLLECAWMEILILDLLWRSLSHEDVLVFASDLCINRERLSSVQLSKLFDETLTLVNVLRQYQINQEQLVLLRACILLNAGVQNLNNEKYFQGLQDKVHSALHYTTVQRQKHPVNHVMKLLLFLPLLRQVSLETIALLSKLQQERKLPPTLGLIGEILSKQSGVSPQFT